MLYKISVFVLIGVFVFSMFYVFTGDKSAVSVTRLEVREDPLNNQGIIFSWDGSIDYPMAKDFSQAYKGLNSDILQIIIELNSPGGSVEEGRRVIDIIKEMNQSYKVWTYVGPEKECLSMCVPIYIQGRVRIAAPDSIWLFHEAKAYDRFTDTEIMQYSHEKTKSDLVFFNRYLAHQDIDEAWLETIRDQVRVRDVWKTGQQLTDERSGIITILE